MLTGCGPSALYKENGKVIKSNGVLSPGDGSEAFLILMNVTCSKWIVTSHSNKYDSYDDPTESKRSSN